MPGAARPPGHRRPPRAHTPRPPRNALRSLEREAPRRAGRSSSVGRMEGERAASPDGEVACPTGNRGRAMADIGKTPGARSIPTVWSRSPGRRARRGHPTRWGHRQRFPPRMVHARPVPCPTVTGRTAGLGHVLFEGAAVPIRVLALHDGGLPGPGGRRAGRGHPLVRGPGLRPRWLGVRPGCHRGTGAGRTGSGSGSATSPTVSSPAASSRPDGGRGHASASSRSRWRA